MRLGDCVLGFLILLGGVVLFIVLMCFLFLLGQKYGVEILFEVVGFLVIVLGVVMLVKGLCQECGMVLVQVVDWVCEIGVWVWFLGVVLLVGVYVLVLDCVGFIFVSLVLVVVMLVLICMKFLLILFIVLVMVLVV